MPPGTSWSKSESVSIFKGELEMDVESQHLLVVGLPSCDRQHPTPTLKRYGEEGKNIGSLAC